MNTQLHQQLIELEHAGMLLQQRDNQIEQKDQQISEYEADLSVSHAEVNSFRRLVTVRICTCMHYF